jgi:AraC-like DNA-binding protein
MRGPTWRCSRRSAANPAQALLPPHQHVIARRVERAKQLPQGGDLTLAHVGACAGFANQSVFTQHVVRPVGVTPGQFQAPARID